MRFPDIYGDNIIFVTEDSAWKYSGNIDVGPTSDFGDLKLGAERKGLA